MLNVKDIKKHNVFLVSFTDYLFMKHIVLVLITGMYFMTSCVQVCNNQPVDDCVPKDYVEHKVNLKNNLGELTISLPIEFDTVYSWKWYEDYVYEMFRFADKKYSLLQENGNWFFAKPDSLYQLTIQYCLDCDDTYNLDDKTIEAVIESIKALDPSKKYDFFIKEIKIINDKKFLIIGFNYQKGETCRSEISLLTEVNGYYVELEFICQAKDCTNFADRVEKSFNSIKFK